MINTISILIGFYFYFRKNIFIILAILSILPLILGESRASILLLPFVLLFLFKRDFFTRKLFSRFLIFGAIVGVVLLSIFFISPRREKGLAIYNLQRLYAQHIRERLPYEQRPQGNLANIILANKIISKNWKTQLFGCGLGNASPSIFETYTGPIYSKYQWAHINNQQIGWTILELGYLGLFFFFIIIYRIYKINKLFFNQIEDRFWKAVSFGFTGIIFLSAVGTVYIPVWYLDITGFCFWIFSAAVLSVRRKRGIF
jgi:hypothetical protein